MGQEISAAGFEEADFQNFTDQLARETASLRDHHASGPAFQRRPAHRA